MPSTSDEWTRRLNAVRFCVVSLGCKVNRVESDTVVAAFLASGAEQVREEDADLVVVNTCTVTGEADKKARKAVRHALKAAPGAQVIATGCAVAVNPGEYEGMSERVSVVHRAELLAALKEASPGNHLRMGRGFRTRVSLKVQDGCDRSCSYCIVHVARGAASSMNAKDVLEESGRYLDGGAKELVLTGIDLGSYDDGGYRLEHLVEDLLELADRKARAGEPPARIRASSLEPDSVSERFIGLMASAQGRICRHLHLPLQSGSSKVLREMSRPYSAADFLDLADELRRRMPSLSLTTDVICGFPGETDDEFQQTVEMARRCRFSKIHVFPYSMRAGTPAAARGDQVAAEVKASRTRQLRSVALELRRQDIASRRGTTELALVEGSHALTESYHELPYAGSNPPGSLIPLLL